MFGSKNKENLEKIESLSRELEYKDEIYAKVAANAAMFESNKQEYETSAQHMVNDLQQISENLDASGAILSENGKLLSALHETMTVAAEDAKAWDEAQDDFLKKLGKVSENSLKAVDNNKHFTDPSKTLSEYADSMKKEYMENIRELKVMAEYSKQMSVLALNAAIDAGRMGDVGKQFVSSAESIREYASNYDKSVRDLLVKCEESQKQVGIMEETIHVLINLLKDNNVAVSKIMKDLNELSKQGKKNKETAPIGVYAQLIETVNLLHDAEAEVDRMEARNRLQLDDVLSEAELQQKEINEITEAFSPIVDMTKSK